MPKKQKLILPIVDAEKEELEHVHGHRNYIYDLVAEGINIPEGFILTSDFYAEFLDEKGLAQKIRALLSTIHYERADSLMQVSNHIKKLLLTSPLPDKLNEELVTEYRKLSGFLKSATVVVLGSDESAKNFDELEILIKKSWTSHFNPKELIYFHQKHLDPTKIKCAVIVQKLIDSKKSGTFSTTDFNLQSNCKLSNNEIEELKKLSKKLKKYFYLPQIASFVIDKNKIYITDLKPMTNTKISYLVLVRHGESEWNALGLWTGWTDIPLSKKGHEQAREAGEKLKDIHFDQAYTSALLRAIQTLDEIKKAKEQKIPTASNKALNERDYGALTGKNKWEVKKEFGEEQFLKWRRGWDEPIPHGESLKDVYHRVVPYYNEVILPKLKSGKNVIIAAHGNSLRALAKYLENISDEDIKKLEIPVGQILIYKIDEDGKVVGKEIRN